MSCGASLRSSSAVEVLGSAAMKFPVYSLIVGCALAASGAVQETHENGFTVESTATSRANPAAVYAALAKPAMWWDPEHTWSGSAKNLTLEARAGGCFCEKLGGGGSVEHGRVIYAQPGVLLRLDAALGPLQDMAATGVLSFKLTPQNGGTLVTLIYRVSGTFTLDAAKLAPMVDHVLS